MVGYRRGDLVGFFIKALEAGTKQWMDDFES